MPAKRTQRYPEEQERWGRRLKGLMAEEDLKTKDVAKALNWSTGNVGHYLTGRNRLKREDLPGFAKALRVSVPFLVRRLEFDLWGDLEPQVSPSHDRASPSHALDAFAFDEVVDDLRQIYLAESAPRRQALVHALDSIGALMTTVEAPVLGHPEPKTREEANKDNRAVFARVRQRDDGHHFEDRLRYWLDRTRMNIHQVAEHANLEVRTVENFFRENPDINGSILWSLAIALFIGQHSDLDAPGAATFEEIYDDLTQALEQENTSAREMERSTP